MIVVRGLLDEARPIIEQNLAGLTDAEYFWEPASDCWGVRRRTDVRAPDGWGRGDWVVETCLDGTTAPTMTTIGWRLMHAYDCTNDFTSRAFGRGARDWNDIEVPGTATGAVELMVSAIDQLHEDLSIARDAVLLSEPDPDFKRERSELLGKAMLEAIHHCAEIGVLRAMFRCARPS